MGSFCPASCWGHWETATYSNNGVLTLPCTTWAGPDGSIETYRGPRVGEMQGQMQKPGPQLWLTPVTLAGQHSLATGKGLSGHGSWWGNSSEDSKKTRWPAKGHFCPYPDMTTVFPRCPETTWERKEPRDRETDCQGTELLYTSH